MTSPSNNVQNSRTSDDDDISLTAIAMSNRYEKATLNKCLDFVYDFFQKNSIYKLVGALILLNVALFHMDKVFFDLILVCSFLFG